MEQHSTAPRRGSGGWTVADALELWDRDTNIRAIVLCAEGKHFCAGADFGSRGADGVAKTTKRGRHLYKEAQRLWRTHKPIVAAVHGAPGTVKSLMIVGHNPGLEESATRLAREPVRRKERARHEALEEKFPTSALAILDFDVSRWRDVEEGSGKLVDFVRPRDL